MQSHSVFSLPLHGRNTAEILLNACRSDPCNAGKGTMYKARCLQYAICTSKACDKRGPRSAVAYADKDTSSSPDMLCKLQIKICPMQVEPVSMYFSKSNTDR